ncbi:carbohydrate ABC transporter permease [Paenibacillus lupini]|uniref:carbohydrate ABC transporter permease n=1 Tax=Paenibacillus lupini TaxID=1450204 RepID=UPI001420DDDA|nr:carbohydrate ABC transporter permease [Paenibacillus lupini]NIK23612.1 putative aldouronate transport system permease protein [Paenibacillus lupini]
MGIKPAFADRITDRVIIVIMLVLIIVTAYPLLYVILASISDGAKMMAHSGILLAPYGFHLDAYVKVLNNPGIWRGYFNTFTIVAASLLVNMSVTSLTAYVLSRKGVFWNKTFIGIILFTMFFNGGLIPFYLVVKGTGLMNSLWSLIIPFSINTFNLIIMRTAFMAVPDSLEESATIDGANHLTIFWRIVLPLSRPTLAVMAFYYMVEKWNAWFYASLFLKDRDLFPLQLVLREILISNSTDSLLGSVDLVSAVELSESIKYATIVVATIPILCVFPFIQRYFVKGVMIGAVKG